MSAAQKQTVLILEPTPPPPPLTKDQQLQALRVAVQALLAHGTRPDIVAQAEHALSISEPRNYAIREMDVPNFLRRKTGGKA